MYVPTYTLSSFVFAFLVWIIESFERCNCWLIKDLNVIPRAVGWLKKSIFNRSDCGYLFAKESTTTSDIRPTKAEYESSWWIRGQLFFQQHVPKAPVVLIFLKWPVVQHIHEVIGAFQLEHILQS
ncbi:hypothetical protein Tco_1259728 [Tanacetum coccineum]